MHSVHGPYGTPEDFAVLVDAAHARGIAVFVDLALHHGRGGRMCSGCVQQSKHRSQAPGSVTQPLTRYKVIRLFQSLLLSYG